MQNTANVFLPHPLCGLVHQHMHCTDLISNVKHFLPWQPSVQAERADALLVIQVVDMQEERADALLEILVVDKLQSNATHSTSALFL